MVVCKAKELTDGILSRLLKGGLWLGAAGVGENAARFVRNMVLARLLAPDALGLMAIVVSVSSLFQVLTGLGVKEAVIQSPRGAEGSYLNAVWWLSCTRGVLLYSLAFAAAPFLASFYDAPELSFLLRIAFVNVLATCLFSVRAFVLVKRLQYREWVVIQQGGGVAGVVTTLILAFYFKSVIALALGFAVEGIAKTVLSYVVCPFIPVCKIDRQDIIAVLRFSGGILGLPLLMLIYNEGAVFAVGKLCSKEELGVFAMILTVARIPSMFNSQLVDLLMPAFSHLQNDHERLNQVILKITTLVILLALPAVLFVLFYGNEVLLLLFGDRYSAGAMQLALLFFNEVWIICSIPIATAYLAMGKPSALRKFSLIRSIIVVLALVPFIHRWGVLGAAFVPPLSMACSFALQLTSIRALTALEIAAYVAVCARGVLAGTPWLVLFVCVGLFAPFQSPLSIVSVAGGGSILLTVLTAILARKVTHVRNFFWPFAAGSS